MARAFVGLTTGVGSGRRGSQRMWLLDKLLGGVIREGRLIIIDHLGRRHEYGDAAADPLTIRFTRPGTAARILRNPQLGAGEAYMEGELLVEPPHEIRDLVMLVMGNAKRAGGLDTPSRWRRVLDRLLWWFDQANDRRRASRNARHHYDLTRQFYELFLDEDRQYTMGYWRSADETLEQAQRDKKALIAAKLRLEPGKAAGMRVLDIGCGWGGLALYLNRHYGCEVLGISLAPDQVRFANERAEAAGVADKVHFELIDYRDVSGSFDRITSVGMIEHVGAGRFGEYFSKTFDLLASDGVMLTHTIGRTGRPGRTDAWTRKHIFPGGYIPAMSELVTAVEDAGWQLGDVEILRFHYALTLREWYDRTRIHADRIAELYDERLARKWLYYLAGAEQAFRYEDMVNFHIQTVKRQSALPMTRDYIAAEAARLMAGDPVPAWHLAQAAE